MSNGGDTFEASTVSHLSALVSDGRLATGTVTALRRFDPVDRPGEAAFEVCSLLDQVGINAPPDSNAYATWSLVLHCLALVRGNHVRSVNVGHAMVAAGISEARARQLLESDRPMLFDLLPRIARRLAASSQPMDWVPFTRLALAAGIDDASAQRIRVEIAHSFQRALSRENA